MAYTEKRTIKLGLNNTRPWRHLGRRFNILFYIYHYYREKRKHNIFGKSNCAAIEYTTGMQNNTLARDKSAPEIQTERQGGSGKSQGRSPKTQPATNASTTYTRRQRETSETTRACLHRTSYRSKSFSNNRKRLHRPHQRRYFYFLHRTSFYGSRVKDAGGFSFFSPPYIQ